MGKPVPSHLGLSQLTPKRQPLLLVVHVAGREVRVGLGLFFCNRESSWESL